MYYECTAVNTDLPYLNQLQKTSLLFVMDVARLLKGKSIAEKAFSFSSGILMGFFRSDTLKYLGKYHQALHSF